MLPVRGTVEDKRLISPLPFFGVLAVVLAYLSPGGRRGRRREEEGGEGGGGEEKEEESDMSLILQPSYAYLPRECSLATRQRLCKAALRANNEEDIATTHQLSPG